MTIIKFLISSKHLDRKTILYTRHMIKHFLACRDSRSYHPIKTLAYDHAGKQGRNKHWDLYTFRRGRESETYGLQGNNNPLNGPTSKIMMRNWAGVAQVEKLLLPLLRRR